MTVLTLIVVCTALLMTDSAEEELCAEVEILVEEDDLEVDEAVVKVREDERTEAETLLEATVFFVVIVAMFGALPLVEVFVVIVAVVFFEEVVKLLEKALF